MFYIFANIAYKILIIICKVMKTLNPSYIFIKFIFFILISSTEVIAADTPSCAVLIHPLESKVEQIKGQGGIWGIFDKNYQVRNHATITLKLDSKITILIVRLKYLCSTKNGVPLEEIAQILLPQLKAKGEQAVMEYLLNLGHFMEEAKNLIAYARFAESNLNRKLEFNQISKTVTESQPFANRFVELSKKIGEVKHEKIMFEAKVLISEIEKFLETNPYLILADKETAEIPHSRYITGDSDAM
jgi:hypothetical protein